MTDREVATISREDLKESIDQGDEFVLVDTLGEQFNQHSHLPGAINLPLEEIGRAEEEIPDEDTEIVVYCMDPPWEKSEEAARELAAMGYMDVKDYPGGKQDWIRHGLPYEGTSSEREEE